MFSFNYEIFFFFFFSSIALTSAIFVIYSKNTVYSVFFLILVFTNMTGLLLVSEVEFLAIMLIIIYVGAITVLFLFVVMMLDIKKIDNNKKNNLGYLPIIFLISFIFFIEAFIVFSKSFTSYQFFVQKNLEMLTYNKLCLVWSRYPASLYKDLPYHYTKFLYKFDTITNIETLGQILYTYYALFLLLAGLILLIALIGAVTLTIEDNKKKNLTKNLYKQLSRNYLKAIYNIKQK